MKTRHIVALGLFTFALSLGEWGLASGLPASSGAGRIRLAQEGIRITVLSSGSGAQVRNLAAGHGNLDLGRVSYTSGARSSGVDVRKKADSMCIRTQFVIRLDAGANNSTGTATLSAFLLHSDPGQTFTLDGVQLSTVPQIIQTQVPLGSAQAHELELEVSKDAAPGTVSNAIGWIVVSD